MEYTKYGLMLNGRLVLTDPFPDWTLGTAKLVATAEPDYYRINNGMSIRWNYPFRKLEKIGDCFFVPRYELRNSVKACAKQLAKKTTLRFTVTEDRKAKRGFYVIRNA